MPEIGWIVTPVPRCATQLGRLTPDRVVEAKDPEVLIWEASASSRPPRDYARDTPFPSRAASMPT